MKNYLLVPTMPTPNGPLHLGHIAGPFLRMDVLARGLRQAGDKVSIVSASDAWETHVLLRALTNDTPPDQICHRYHREIADGLAALNICYDEFIDVLDAPLRAALSDLANSVLAALAKQPGAFRVLKEAVPFSNKYKMPIAGALIEGTCPNCHSSMGGFFCECCGAETSPGKLIDPHSRLPDDTWQWRTYDSLYLQVRDVMTLRGMAARICADHKLVDLAFEGLALSDDLIRLTHPGAWGIPALMQDVSRGSVIFSYSALLAFSLLCAGATGSNASVTPAEGTAFGASSETITIMSFGIDNSMPYLVSLLAQALACDIKPFDHYLTNYFGTLDGKKFSTSRNHAIWALDAHRLLNANTDTIRAYLAVVNPQHGETDFSVGDFGKFKVDWEDRLEENIKTALAARPKRTDVPDIQLLARLLDARNAALDPARFALSNAVKPVNHWMLLADNGGATRSWALGLSVLAYPLMPDLSARIWCKEGMSGLPTFDALVHRLQA